MSKPARLPTDDVIGEMATALSESTRYLVDKAESFNRSEAMRLERLVFVLIVANVVALLVLGLGAFVAYREVLNVLDSNNDTTAHASEALVQSKLTERKLDTFMGQQKQFNKTTIEALEELSK